MRKGHPVFWFGKGNPYKAGEIAGIQRQGAGESWRALQLFIYWPAGTIKPLCETGRRDLGLCGGKCIGMGTSLQVGGAVVPTSSPVFGEPSKVNPGPSTCLKFKLSTMLRSAVLLLG
jgi:hypothetical protein